MIFIGFRIWSTSDDNKRSYSSQSNCSSEDLERRGMGMYVSHSTSCGNLQAFAYEKLPQIIPEYIDVFEHYEIGICNVNDIAGIEMAYFLVGWGLDGSPVGIWQLQPGDEEFQRRRGRVATRV